MPPRATSHRPWLIAALVFAASWWAVDLGLLGAGVPHSLDDLWEDALVARGLLEGQPWRTWMIYPPLWSLRDPVSLTIPVLAHGPLLPLVLAGLLATLGPAAVDGFAWIAAACAILAVIPLYRLAERRFGAPIGAAAGFVFTVSPLTLEAVHHAASVAVGALLVMLAFEWAERDRPRPVAAGLALGAGYLARPELLLAAPILAWLAGRGDRGLRQAMLLVVAFVACATPWWIHHLIAVGSPFFSVSSYTLAGFWAGHPGTSIIRDFEVPPARWPSVLAAAFPGLSSKWIAFFPHALKHALFAPGGGIGWAMLLGVPAAWAVPAARRGLIGAAALALIPIATMTLTIYQKLYVMPFLGLFALASVLGVRALFERLPVWAHRPRTWIGALVLLAIPATGPALRTAVLDARSAVPLLANERAGLAIAARPERMRRPIFSDRPSFASWSTRRPALWQERSDFLELYEEAGRSRVRTLGLPVEVDSLDTWFHDGHWAPGTRVSPREYTAVRSHPS